MAEGWVLKNKIVRSKKFRKLNGNDFAQLLYCLLISCKNVWGLHPADPDSLKIALGPFDYTREPEVYFDAIKDLARVGLIRLWFDQGDPWLYMEGHDKEHPVDRKGFRGKNPPLEIPERNQAGVAWVDLSEVTADRCEPVRIDADRCDSHSEGVGSEGVGVRDLEGKGKETADQNPSLSPEVTESKPVSQAGEPLDPSPPVRGTPGSGISRAGDVAAGLVGDTGRTAAVFEDPRPIGAEYDEILNLKQLHADLFGYPINPQPVKGDLSCRILDALRTYRLSKCQDAMKGHHREATKEGSPRGRGLENAFPPLGRQKNKLDRDRFWTLITAGQKGSGKAARSTFVPTKKLSDSEQQAAAKKRKEILKEMGLGK